MIAQAGIGRTAVGEYIRRAAVIGITWPVPDELDDAALERKLFAPAGYNPPRSKPLPDWAHVHAELRRRSVTLALLWQDYRGQHSLSVRLTISNSTGWPASTALSFAPA